MLDFRTLWADALTYEAFLAKRAPDFVKNAPAAPAERAR